MDTPAGPLSWQVARVVDSRRETPSAKTLLLEVPGWGGHTAGQHIDLKLTAEDGYSAQRSYSLGNPPDGDRIELTVQQIPGGEVSPYLNDVAVGDEIEIRGPIGGWFVWRPGQDVQVLLVGGGAGIVPLMAMLRHRVTAGTESFQLVYSVRTPDDVYYAAELDRLQRECEWLRVVRIYTRRTASTTLRQTGRIRSGDLSTIPAGVRSYVCGPTGFVETVSAILIERGHPAATIRTERFGPGDGSRNEDR